jgi:leucyl aminopeptidase (aminopeptidase T)
MSDMAWNKIDTEELTERFALMRERIANIPQECAVPEQYRDYFSQMSRFLCDTIRIYDKKKDNRLADRNLEECRQDQERLYRMIAPDTYETSYANPAYAVAQFGEEAGRLLTFLASELEACIACAFEGRIEEMTLLLELFVQVYNCMEEEDIREAKQTIYWYFHDYSELFVEKQIRDIICPEDNFFTDLIMHADLTDLRYLYRYGLPVGENELGIAEFLNEMSEDEIQAMADTYTEGYRIGFATTGKDISKKKTVQIHYQIGFERMIRAAIRNFEKIGLQPTISREPVSSFLDKGRSKRGAYSTSVNRQYDFDHREDKAFYFDKAFVERRLEVLRTVFEQHKELAAVHGGPAVLEVFGETPFSPESKKEAIHYSEKQQQLSVYNASEYGQITNEYIKGEERSFTIIAYPIPEIGEQFKDIFAETVVINTLDYEKYQKMQQNIIDVLDQAEKVQIMGTGENRTNLTVSILPLNDPAHQTAFENCVADVNIPVGEVFTSPVLAGTNGVLHVSEVFLNGLQYLNLELTFTDGMVTDYTCSNFDTEEENKKYIRDNVLMRHDTLPMGEFAIGTNTTAYRMARKYQIADKLPILIAEKTGPHFAVGDTCYSNAEDTSVYNPDGKEIMPRDNEISILRKEDPAKAYFNCHTDITIPYDELGAITVIRKDGSTQDIIRDGLFQVAGAEELNAPLL